MPGHLNTQAIEAIEVLQIIRDIQKGRVTVTLITDRITEIILQEVIPEVTIVQLLPAGHIHLAQEEVHRDSEAVLQV